MKVIVFGASGMVGQGALRECLAAADVERVLAVGRAPLSQAHPKLRSIGHADFTDFTPLAADLTGYDACFFCLGVSSAGMSEAEYTRVTYEYTLAAARVLAAANPGMTFIYVSGQGTRTDEGGGMWARVKGKTENALLALPFRSAYMFRPGMIQPLHGIVSKTRSYRILYAVLRPLTWIARKVAPRTVATTETMGRAMLACVRTQPAEQLVGPRATEALAQLAA